MLESSEHMMSERRRFVIDLNQHSGARTPARKSKRRWPKALLILATTGALLVMVGAGAAYFWWQSYKTTPAYSLALLLDASQHNDNSVMEQIIDSDQIVDSLRARITEKTVARYGGTLNASTRKRIEAMVPALLPGVKTSVRAELTKRVAEVFEKSEPKPFVVLALGIPYLVNITSDGDAARATAPVGDAKVEFVLRRDGERWKITGINDDTVVDRIVDSIISQFPAIGQVK
ncbi:MAG TPA: hypothetical protein VJM12_04255 [Pyrinomonadaceae bacterium]|nr:hypothetical protein [Pyrinomonadaceae bacterium]